MEPNLSQALHLINGNTVEGKIRQGGVVRDLIKAGHTPEQVIDELYVRCLSRRPTQQERTALLALIAEEKDPAPVLDDLFWSLLNSKEFLFNH